MLYAKRTLAAIFIAVDDLITLVQRGEGDVFRRLE